MAASEGEAVMVARQAVMVVMAVADVVASSVAARKEAVGMAACVVVAEIPEVRVEQEAVALVALATSVVASVEAKLAAA